MAKKKPEPVFHPRVQAALVIRRDIAEQLAKLKLIESEIIASGAGVYCDEAGHTVTAVAETPGKPGVDSYALPNDRVDIAKQLAGESFGELFERHVTFSPKSGFVDRVDALLTPARGRDLVALCLVPGQATDGKAAYCRWPKIEEA